MLLEPEFITGPAGSGKTHKIKSLQWLTGDPPTMYITATTGVAAINVGGYVVNSLAGWKDDAAFFTKLKMGIVKQALRKLQKQGINILALEEVSMASGPVVGALYDLCVELDISFLLCGDPYQLRVSGRPFFDFPKWNEFKVTELTEIHRQTDREFIDFLSALRKGDKTTQNFIRPFLQEEITPDFDGVTLFSTNKEVNDFNRTRYLCLGGRPALYETIRMGDEKRAWKNVPDCVETKEGEYVMILRNSSRNDEGQCAYVKGDTGVVVETRSRSIVVELDRTGSRVTVSMVNEKFETHEPGQGSITYAPWRSAYAATVHKVQGLTLDKLQVCLNPRLMSRQHGALYTALSRLRSSSGLHIVAKNGRRDYVNSICMDNNQIPPNMRS